MKLNINFTDLDAIVIFSNVEEDDWMGRERGATFDDISIEMDLVDFCALNQEQLRNLQGWIYKNAEIRMRAACHERDEKQAAYERQREEKQRQYDEERKQKKNKKEGFVYLVGAENGNYKIGKAKHVNERINTFGVKLPIKTWLVHSFSSENYDRAEMTLHERFAEKRTHGEWFLLSEDDVEYIKSLQDGAL